MKCWNRFLTKITALICASVFLFAGCSVLKENDAGMNISVKPERDFSGKLDYYPSFYTADRLSGQISSHTEVLEIPGWEDSAKIILERSFEDIMDRVFGMYYKDFLTIEDMHFTGEILDIRLSSALYINDQQRFELTTLITDTMVRNFSVNYVNLTVGDTGYSIDGHSLGLSEFQEGSLIELYEKEQTLTEQSEDGYMKNFGIYLVDEKNGYIIPEVRSVQVVKSGDPLETVVNVLDELSNGSYGNDALMTPLAGTYIRRNLKGLSSEELNKHMTYEAGTLTINDADSLFRIREDSPRLSLYESSILYTVKGVLPDIQRMVCNFRHKVTVTEVSGAEEYLGNSVSIYLPNDTMTSIQKVERIIASKDTLNEDVLLSLIAAGKTDGDPDDLISIFPGGLTRDDLIGVYYNGDCLVLDFTDEFMLGMGRLTEQGVNLMLYSIVDTLCQITPVKRVQFLINGEMADSVENAGISLRSPLFYNPGIIRN